MAIHPDQQPIDLKVTSQLTYFRRKRAEDRGNLRRIFAPRLVTLSAVI
jgi:hypothetical protein